MRPSILASAVALAVASVSFNAAAQSPDRDAEIAALRAQLAELQAKVDALEVRTDAQSDINIGTQESLDRMATTAPVIDTKGGLKVTSADKQFEFKNIRSRSRLRLSSGQENRVIRDLLKKRKGDRRGCPVPCCKWAGAAD